MNTMWFGEKIYEHEPDEVLHPNRGACMISLNTHVSDTYIDSSTNDHEWSLVLHTAGQQSVHFGKHKSVMYKADASFAMRT